jgi:hypothetical protein
MTSAIAVIELDAAQQTSIEEEVGLERADAMLAELQARVDAAPRA